MRIGRRKALKRFKCVFRITFFIEYFITVYNLGGYTRDTKEKSILLTSLYNSERIYILG